MTQSLLDQIADLLALWGPHELKYTNSQWCVVTKTKQGEYQIPLQRLMEMALIENLTVKDLLQVLRLEVESGTAIRTQSENETSYGCKYTP